MSDEKRTIEHEKLAEGVELKIPDIALGKIRPYFLDKFEREEFIQKRAERKARLYFIGGLIGTLVGTVLGWVLGKFF